MYYKQVMALQDQDTVKVRLDNGVSVRAKVVGSPRKQLKLNATSFDRYDYAVCDLLTDDGEELKSVDQYDLSYVTD